MTEFETALLHILGEIFTKLEHINNSLGGDPDDMKVSTVAYTLQDISTELENLKNLKG